MPSIWCKKITHPELGHVLVRAVLAEGGEGGICVQSCVQGSYNSTYGTMRDLSVADVVHRIESDKEFSKAVVKSHFDLFGQMVEEFTQEFNWFDIIEDGSGCLILLNQADTEDSREGARPTVMHDYKFYQTSDFDLPIESITADKVDSLFKFVCEFEEPKA